MECRFQDQCNKARDSFIRKQYCSSVQTALNCPYIFDNDTSDSSDAFDISLLSQFQEGNDEINGNVALELMQDDIFDNQDDDFDDDDPSQDVFNYVNLSPKDIYNKYISYTRRELKKFGDLACEKIGDGDMPEAAFGYFNANGRYEWEQYNWLFRFWREKNSDRIVCVISPGYSGFAANPNNSGDLSFKRFCARMNTLPGKNLISTFEKDATPRGKANLLDKLVMFSAKLEASAATGSIRNSAHNTIFENLRVLNDYFDYVFQEYAEALWCEQEKIVMALMEKFGNNVASNNSYELTLPYDDSFVELPPYFAIIFEMHSLRVKAERYTNDCMEQYKALALESGESGRTEFMSRINSAILSAWKP